MQIARPMEKIWKEIIELIVAIGAGLVVFTITLTLLGYFVAGKVLQPWVDPSWV